MKKAWKTAAVTFCFCSFIYAQQTRSLADIARESKAKSGPAKPCSSSTTNPARATTAPLPDLADEPDACKYMDGVMKLLADGKFAELERVAAAARSSKARFVGGGWKLYTFYLGVGAIPNGGANQADRDSHFESLKRWLSSQPASVTPYVALAKFYLSDGWTARGAETADKVTPEGWRILEERARQARAILNQSATLKTKCPEWYHTMMDVAQAQGWDPEEVKPLFDEAIAFEPEYHYFYQKVGFYLLPKWYGEEGDLKRFAQESADRIGGKDGDILYWQIAAGAIAGSGNGRDGTDLSWLRIRRGYRALVEKYGETVLRQNEMCYMAVKFRDPLFAQDLFARIGENWTATWHKREYFDNSRNWTLTNAAPLQGIKDVYNQVAANLETTEGEAYAEVVVKQFLASYAANVRQCPILDFPQSGHFEMALKLGTLGAVEQVIVYPETAVGDCLRPKIQKATFPPPPKPGYWISFSVMPR